VQLFNGKTIPGPYRKDWREYWLKRVLEVQQGIRENGPKEMREIELISNAEMQEIRRLWLYDKHEYDDTLPDIFKQVTGEEFSVIRGDDQLLDREDWDRLRTICGEDDIFFQLQTELLDIQRAYSGMTRRAGIYEAIEKRLKAAQFASGEEAFAARDVEQKRADDIMKLRTIRRDKPEAEKPKKKNLTSELKSTSRQQGLFDQQPIEQEEK
jgi:DNA sulfur modification protein DndC